MAFGDTCALAPPQTRGLQLQDPTKREKYKIHLKAQLEYHTVQLKKTELAALARDGGRTDDTVDSYRKLDKKNNRINEKC